MSGCPMWSPSYWARQRVMGDPDLRVSDAERSQVADALSRHFAEGRLDQAELDERLQRAMSAKTRRDLGGLLDDLPPLVAPPAAGPHRHRSGIVLLVVTFLLFSAVASSILSWQWHFPWFLAALVLFVLWRRSRWHWHHHRRWPGPGWGGPVSPAGPPGPGTWPGRPRGWWV